MISFYKYILILLPLCSLLIGQEFDSLTYIEKFNFAVKSYKEGRYKIAESQFKFILMYDRNYKDPAAQLLMAKSQYKQNKFIDAIRSSKSFLLSYPNSPYESDALILLGDIALKKEKFTDAFRYFLSSRSMIEDRISLNSIDKRIFLCLGIGLNEEKIEGLLFKENNSLNRSIINLARAYQSWKVGRNIDLEMILSSIDPYYLPDYYSVIYGRLNNSVKIKSLKTITIAVLLPLSGYSREKGESYLLGIAEALNVDRIQNYIRFLIYDTAGKGVNALRITKNSNQNRKIAAVLGPITREEILSISGLELKIPIFIPKSAPIELSELAENLFFLSPSSKTIANRTAQMIIQELGFSKIAILAPAYGESKITTDYFIEACFEMGIDPVSIEWYMENPIDISKQLKNIRKIAWSLIPNEDEKIESGDLKIDSLDALFDVDVTDFFELPKEKIEVMSKKDSSKVMLETIQAIYVPIRAEELRYIGTQFPVYNFKTMLFGNENWLDMKLLNKDVIGPHVQGMKIISDIGSPLYDTQENLYKNYYLLAIDHVDFINSVINKGNFKRKKLVDQLRKHKGFYGQHTSIIFKGLHNNENGSSQVLEYKNKRIKTLGIYDGDNFRNQNK